MDEAVESALKRIEDGAPNVVAAVWKNLPSPYEIDMGDDEAVKRLLAAIAEVVKPPEQNPDQPHR